MDRLTPELHLISAFDGDSATGLVVESRELDFNLARRSGVVINRIVSQIGMHTDTTSGHDVLSTGIQELDLDPDNVAVEFGTDGHDADDVVIDSSRVLRHIMQPAVETAAGVAEVTHTIMGKDWHHVPPNERPISITNLRHHFGSIATISQYYHVELHVDYFIVELELREIGILNASRR